MIRVYSVCRLPIFAVALNFSVILVPNIGMLTADLGQAAPIEQFDQGLHILPFDMNL